MRKQLIKLDSKLKEQIWLFYWCMLRKHDEIFNFEGQKISFQSIFYEWIFNVFFMQINSSNRVAVLPEQSLQTVSFYMTVLLVLKAGNTIQVINPKRSFSLWFLYWPMNRYNFLITVYCIRRTYEEEVFFLLPSFHLQDFMNDYLLFF